MSNLPPGVSFSDIPGESPRDRAREELTDEITYLLNRAAEDSIDVLNVLSDLVEDFYPRWEVRKK